MTGPTASPLTRARALLRAGDAAEAAAILREHPDCPHARAALALIEADLWPEAEAILAAATGRRG